MHITTAVYSHNGDFSIKGYDVTGSWMAQGTFTIWRWRGSDIWGQVVVGCHSSSNNIYTYLEVQIQGLTRIYFLRLGNCLGLP